MINIQHPAYPQADTALVDQTATRQYLVYHHTAGNLTQTPLEIDAEERSGGKYSFIPYNYLVDHEGNIYEGRPLQFLSAATYGANSLSVAVCAIGNYEAADAGYTGPPSAALISGLTDIGVYLHQQIPSIELTTWHNWIGENVAVPHYSTACCGSELIKQIPSIKEAISDALGKS